jgi:hypothetical protein
MNGQNRSKRNKENQGSQKTQAALSHSFPLTPKEALPN